MMHAEVIRWVKLCLWSWRRVDRCFDSFTFGALRILDASLILRVDLKASSTGTSFPIPHLDKKSDGNILEQ